MTNANRLSRKFISASFVLSLPLLADVPQTTAQAFWSKSAVDSISRVLAINANAHIPYVTKGRGGDGNVWIEQSSRILMTDRDFWEQVNHGLADTSVSALTSDASGHIFAGTNNGRIFRTTNNGENWIEINTGFGDCSILTLVSTTAGDLLVGTSCGLFFLPAPRIGIPDPNPRNCAVLSIAVNSSGHIFIGTDTCGIFRSTDNGMTWAPVSTGLTGGRVGALAINANGYVFAGTSDGVVFRSTNNGDSWTVTNLEPYGSVNVLTFDANGQLFVRTSRGVFCSARPEHPCLPNVVVTSLGINSDGLIFAGTFGNGVFRSSNSGLNWEQINSGLTNPEVRALAINSADVVFAGTGGGVFRRIRETTSVNLPPGDVAANYAMRKMTLLK